MLAYRFLAAAFGAAILAMAGSAPAAPSDRSPPTVEEFVAEPAFAGPVLSPSGKRVAFVRTSAERRSVVVYDFETRAARELVGGDLDQGVFFNWIHWKDEDRLIIATEVYREHRVNASDTGRVKRLQAGSVVLAVNRDGTNVITLLEHDENLHRELHYKGGVLDLLRQDPDHILMPAYTKIGAPGVWRVNVRTGEGDLIEKGLDRTVSWLTDRNGAIVARWDASNRIGGGVVLMSRAPGERTWTEVLRIKPRQAEEFQDYTFLGPTEDPAQQYVLVRPKAGEEGDVAAVRIFDFRTRTLGPVLWRHARYDAAGVIVDSRTYALLAGCYVADVYRCDYADPAKAATYRGIDRFFDGERNIVPVSNSADDRKTILLVTGPDEPGTYYLYERDQARVTPIGLQHPKLTPDRLGRMEKVSWKARDGTELSGYLTVPPNAPSGPLPLVVMPHGGPEARDAYDYDLWGQFLATRGYAVFQPNFRGSTGFGRRFAEAGYGQWGGVMQTDVEDGVQQLVAAGRVDPGRMCVFGASYGGYVALWAAAEQPGRYRCAASFSGVSDLAESVAWEGRIFGDDSARYEYWVKSIGHPKTDRARLDQASPLTFAERFQAPVFMVHGEQDAVVPVQQSEAMERALRRHGKTVTLIKLREEGHAGWREYEHRRVLRELAAFLARSLGPAPAAQP